MPLWECGLRQSAQLGPERKWEGGEEALIGEPAPGAGSHAARTHARTHARDARAFARDDLPELEVHLLDEVAEPRDIPKHHVEHAGRRDEGGLRRPQLAMGGRQRSPESHRDAGRKAGVAVEPLPRESDEALRGRGRNPHLQTRQAWHACAWQGCARMLRMLCMRAALASSSSRSRSSVHPPKGRLVSASGISGS